MNDFVSSGILASLLILTRGRQLSRNEYYTTPDEFARFMRFALLLPGGRMEKYQAEREEAYCLASLQTLPALVFVPFSTGVDR